MRNGIKTTIPLHRRPLDAPDFPKGLVSATFLERFLASYFLLGHFILASASS